MGKPIPTGLPDEELRQWLLKEIAELDQLKRIIRDQINQSGLPTAALSGVKREVWQRRAKAKIQVCNTERDTLRLELVRVNQRLKVRAQLKYRGGVTLEFGRVFVQLARVMLDPEVFEQIEREARRILEQEKH